MTYRSANVQIEVGGVELAERAQQIAKQKDISFGEALFQARREFLSDVQVQQNTGSPLRDQQQSTTPPSSDIRNATIEGLKTVGSQWDPARGGSWIATTGSQVLKDGINEVCVRLRALGMGPQIVDGLTSDLFTFLNNLVTSGVLSFPSIISQAGDHIQQRYEEALKNKVASQVWSEEQFAEAARIGGYSYIDMDSMRLRDSALQIAKRKNISFGEALTLARSGAAFADDVVEPSVIKDTVHTAVRDHLGTALQGKKKVVRGFDLKQTHEKVMSAVKKLNISGSQEIGDAVQASFNKLVPADGEGIIDPADLDAISSAAGESAAAAYQRHLKAVS